ncbi:hypothetical protein GCM10027348_06810 [Hymenobacter tenuis]
MAENAKTGMLGLTSAYQRIWCVEVEYLFNDASEMLRLASHDWQENQNKLSEADNLG